MRILCDQNVHKKYRKAFQQSEHITVTTVEEALRHDAEDASIAIFAEANDWVVFTTDDDFYTAGGNHGLMVYDQIDDPPPGDIVDAIRKIDRVYESAADIVETVPDGWL